MGMESDVMGRGAFEAALRRVCGPGRIVVWKFIAGQTCNLELARGTCSKITNFRLCFSKARTEMAWKVGLGSVEEEE